MRPLSRRFFRREPIALARALLGQTLVRTLRLDGRALRLAGRIVEVEAYLGVPDRAAHSYAGRHSERNHSLYLDGGHAYVYFTYGLHHCVNVVADREGVPTACLIRALEPVEGIEVMRRHRAGKIPPHRLEETDLCSGPAKLTQALAIDRGLDGADLLDGAELFLERGARVGEGRIVRAPRIGVDYAGDWKDEPLRFYVGGNPHVSVRR